MSADSDNKKMEDLQRRNAALQQELNELKQAPEKSTPTPTNFLANMSHELRTPMHGILSFSRFGMQKVSSAPRDKLADYFEQINTSANRLMRILNDLLDLSKHNEAKFEYHFAPANILDLINSVSLEFNASIREKELSLQIIPAPTSTTLSCDTTKLRQVFSNLLTNAIKYSPKGNTLTYAFKPTTLTHNQQQQPALQISLTDQGIGIPTTEFNEVFTKFFQSSRTRLGSGGTGLGLAICKAIVQAHNGIIEAAPNPEGEGTIFSFTIPIEQREPTP